MSITNGQPNPSDLKILPDAGAGSSGEGTADSRQHQEIFERPSAAHTRQPILRTNPTTGQKYWDQPLRRPMEEIGLKYRGAVEGLRVFTAGNGITLLYEFDSAEPIDEGVARDAQCRAGWSDYAYGFWGFQTVKLPWGAYAATWKSSNSNAD